MDVSFLYKSGERIHLAAHDRKILAAVKNGHFEGQMRKTGFDGETSPR